MRVRTRYLEGEAAEWDPAAPEPFRRLAGDRFAGVTRDCAILLTDEGTVLLARPGWLAIVPDDAAAGEVHFTPPTNVGTSGGCEWEPASRTED